MSIIFNLLFKRWKELLILLLVGVIFLMRGCGTDYSDKEIINVDGEDFELIKKEVDTVFVEKEVKVTKYVPKYITKEVIKEVETAEEESEEAEEESNTVDLMEKTILLVYLSIMTASLSTTLLIWCAWSSATLTGIESCRSPRCLMPS